MGRHIEKVKPVDLKYDALVMSYDRRERTAESTIKHRNRGRMRTRLNAAKFEARRSGNSDAYIQSGVDEMMRIIGTYE